MSLLNVSIQDITELAHTWGFEDALEGVDQRGSAFFPLASDAWNAYNDGFLDGAQMYYSLTGVARHVWMPQFDQSANEQEKFYLCI